MTEDGGQETEIFEGGMGNGEERLWKEKRKIVS
jgi:hypothetical protein